MANQTITIEYRNGIWEAQFETENYSHSEVFNKDLGRVLDEIKQYAEEITDNAKNN